MRALLLIVGLALLAAGLGLGLAPASATIAIPATATSVARGDSYSCGSPWAADRQSMDAEQHVADLAAGVSTVQGTPAAADNTAALCATAVGSRGVFGAVLAVLGALTLLGLGLIIAARRGPGTVPNAAG